jgi:hypothetical protein
MVYILVYIQFCNPHAMGIVGNIVSETTRWSYKSEEYQLINDPERSGKLFAKA